MTSLLRSIALSVKLKPVYTRNSNGIRKVGYFENRICKDIYVRSYVGPSTHYPIYADKNFNIVPIEGDFYIVILLPDGTKLLNTGNIDIPKDSVYHILVTEGHHRHILRKY